MIVASEEPSWKRADSPQFGPTLCGKRARCENEGLSDFGSSETFLLLRKLSQDGIRASAAKGRLSTISTDALRQQESADHFMNVVSQRCVPVFDVLKDLSTALQDECRFTFPVMGKVLEELTQSAIGVSETLQELSETKEERAKENKKLNQKAAQLRQAAAELNQEIAELEKNIATIKSSIDEKQTGRAYVDSTSRPIEELAARRKEECEKLRGKCEKLELGNNQKREELARLQCAHEAWLQDKNTALQNLRVAHENTIKHSEELQKEISELEAKTAKLGKQNQKENSALCLLRAQIDSQGFCIDLLKSKVAAAEEEIKNMKERLESTTKQREELEKAICSSEQLMPEVLKEVEATEAALREQTRRLKAAEEAQALFSSQAQGLREKVFGVRKETETAKSRLGLLEIERSLAREAIEEKGNQIFMFAEEMQLSFHSEMPFNVVASTIIKSINERLSDLRDVLSSAQQTEEEMKLRCCELETACLAVEGAIEEAKRPLETPDSINQRNQSIIDVKEKKNQMEKSVAAARDALFALEKEFAEKKELQQKEKEAEEEAARSLAEESEKWKERLAELERPNSAARKSIAEEELAICDEHFRQQIHLMRAQHEKEIEALETELAAVREKTIQQEKRIEKQKAFGEMGGRHEANEEEIIINSRKCPSARKKIHSRRLIGPSDAVGASLSTPHLHALREKLTMSSSQISNKTRCDSSEALKAPGVFLMPDASLRPGDTEQVRSTKAQKTGRRSGGESGFDIFAQ